MPSRSGPLNGLTVVELGGVGAVPFCAMLLADMGARVLRIERPAGYDGGAPIDARYNLMNRSRPSIPLDLKHPLAIEAVLELIRNADVVLEGFRPGVAERLGLGQDVCLRVNPRLVYGRLTGWGQEGPLAQDPGHDINFISVTGMLHSIGASGGPPSIPLNLGGDLGGGALYLAMGVLAALWERRESGHGQVIDAAMIDGAASLMTPFYGFRAADYWDDERGTNRLDSGAPWYNVYETLDGRWISIGASEARFWRNAMKVLGIEEDELPEQHDRSQWPAMTRRLAEIFRSRTRDEWCSLAEGAEACITPVLDMSEAPVHEHLRERGSFVEVDGLIQPAPAPRFSRTPSAIQQPPGLSDATDEVLAGWGLPAGMLATLRSAGALGEPPPSPSIARSEVAL